MHEPPLLFIAVFAVALLALGPACSPSMRAVAWDTLEVSARASEAALAAVEERYQAEQEGAIASTDDAETARARVIVIRERYAPVWRAWALYLAAWDACLAASSVSELDEAQLTRLITDLATAAQAVQAAVEEAKP